MSTPPFLDLPPRTRRERFAVGSTELAALVAEPVGDPASTVLLVPGFTGSKEDFIAVLEPLAAPGRRVVAIDQRGQYESKGGDDPASYALDALARDVVELTELLDGPVHLVGHSLGGLVARAAAITAPERLSSLTLLCSGPGPVPAAQHEALRMLLQALPLADLGTIFDVRRRMDADAGLPEPPADVMEFLRERFVANNPVALARLAQQLMDVPDRTAELAAVTARAGLPVLVAHGETDDVWSPQEQAQMAARLGAAHTVVVGAGHSPAADRPEATVAALEGFWVRLSAGAVG